MEKAEAASVQTLYFQLWKLLPYHETCLHCRILKQVLTCLFPDNHSCEMQIGLQLQVFWLSG